MIHFDIGTETVMNMNNVLNHQQIETQSNLWI